MHDQLATSGGGSLRARGTLIVSNEASNTLSFIDPVTDSVFATLAVGNRPRGLAVSLDGKTVYVALGRENAVAVVESTYYVTSGVCNLGAIGGC